MVLVALKCPNCGGEIQLDDEREFGFCLYCGSKVVLTERISQKISIDETEKADSLLRIAYNYYHNNVVDKALVFADKALESNPECADAWYIRGMCSDSLGDKRVALSTALDFGLSEPEIESARVELDKVQSLADVKIVNNVTNYPVTLTILVDGKVVPSSDGVANVRLIKGRHTFSTSASRTGVTSGETTLDIQEDSKIVITATMGMLYLKVRISIQQF